MTVEWKDPPVRGPGAWRAKLAPLLERPNTWALVHQSPTARAAYNLKVALDSGKHDLPEGEWEFTARKTKTGGEIYARYIGIKEVVA